MRKWEFQRFVARFDLYPKLSIEIRKKTSIGGLIAIMSLIIISMLLYFQIDLLITSVPTKFVLKTDLIPRTQSGKLDFNLIPKMRISFDITFFHIPCAFMNINILDSFKDPVSYFDAKIRFQRYDFKNQPIYDYFTPTNEKPSKNYCGPCYSLKDGCCNTCQEVRNLFESRSMMLPALASLEQCIKDDFSFKVKDILSEKCRVHGSVTVQQHPGYVYFGHDVSLFTNSTMFKFAQFNMSHHIHKFAFGGRTYKSKSSLNDMITLQNKVGKMKTNYFIHIVPIGLDNCMYSFSATSVKSYRDLNSTKRPEALFKYDIAPFAAIHEKKLSGKQFLSQTFSIIGGIYAIFTFMDLLCAEICDKCYNSGMNLPKAE